MTSTFAMSESLLATLTAEPWSFDPDSVRPVQIRFNEDGTGELLCFIEFHVFLAVELDWKLLGPAPTERKISISGSSPTTPTQLAEMEMEITLTKRLHPLLRKAGPSSLPTAERWFAEEAFQTKRFTVHLQQGRFPAPTQLDVGSASDWQRFSLRLVLDPSVFPPYSEWNSPDEAPAAYQFWQWKEFCSRELPDTALARIQEKCVLM
ncbi:uncharacterized protein N7459_005181 [Penicillium hispanicum]|uniref:uncharacterized protein n=1 Tax=Penicillium hispanicum TaxID=1080232 RepID=UPI0025400CDE|nr:uncharacterized protein N7459_005181 [Penicillium hispanicum]KAJ5585381.1 hypothetical protein N7459_005181 [Penicillium hispanicum]